MWKLKSLAISVVVVGTLLFGAVVAYAGWGWNAKVDVEGTKISTGWSVAKGGKSQYQAAITISVPANADVSVYEVARSETVSVVHTDQLCSNGAVDATITYLVTGRGHGKDVSVSVDEAGRRGQNFGSATGTLGTPISVNVAIPGDCN